MDPKKTKTTTATATTAKPAAAPAATPAPAAAAPAAKKDPEMYTGSVEAPKRVGKSVIRAAIEKKTGAYPELMRAAEQIAFRGNGHVPAKIASMSDKDYKMLSAAADEWVKVINKHEDIAAAIKKANGEKAAQDAIARAAMAKQRAEEKAAKEAQKAENEKADKKFGEVAIKQLGKTEAAVNSSLETGLSFLEAFGSKGVQITAQGAIIDQNLSAQDTLEAMGKLVRGADASKKLVGNAFNFALGDMVCFYAEHHGETYTSYLATMLEGTDLSLSHVRKLPTIAKAFPVDDGVRYPNLSWGHFQEAISVSAEKKESLTEKDGKTAISDKTFEKLNEAFKQIRYNVLKEASEGDATKTATGIVVKVKPTSWVRTEVAKRKLALYKPFSEKARKALEAATADSGEGEGSGESGTKKAGKIKAMFVVVPFDGAPITCETQHVNMLDGNAMVIDLANGRYINSDTGVWTPLRNVAVGKDGANAVPADWGAEGELAVNAEAGEEEAAEETEEEVDEEAEEGAEEEAEEGTEETTDEIDDLLASENGEEDDPLA